MNAKFYIVGGYVRDFLLNQESKDLDFAVEAESFEAMHDAVVARGCDVKVIKEEFLTIRAIDPKHGGVDFVLCRKDGTYAIDGRRPDFVEPGTLLDDLARRDATCNAIAMTESGEIIDPFNGRADLSAGILRCVGNTEKRFKEDSLRIVRFLRFSITKGLTLHKDALDFIKDENNAKLLDAISVERLREELLRCFNHDTPATLAMLGEFPAISRAIFSRNLKLTPTIFVR